MAVKGRWGGGGEEAGSGEEERGERRGKQTLLGYVILGTAGNLLIRLQLFVVVVVVVVNKLYVCLYGLIYMMNNWWSILSL